MLSMVTHLCDPMDGAQAQPISIVVCVYSGLRIKRADSGIVMTDSQATNARILPNNLGGQTRGMLPLTGHFPKRSLVKKSH